LRQVIFLGDFIGRGPKIREVLLIAKNMVNKGAALVVTGKHELDTVAYHAEDSANLGHFLKLIMIKILLRIKPQLINLVKI